MNTPHGTRMSLRFVVLAAAVLAAAPARAQDQGLADYDSGISVRQCIDVGTNRLVPCATASLTGQDGQLGRDANAATNDPGDGWLGASFGRVCNSGESAGQGTCPAQPVAGPGHDNWGCNVDLLTGMWWEVKTTSGLRAASNRYTNYSATYDPRGEYGSPTDATGYVKAVNAQGLCGHADWGLGHASKLQPMMSYGRQSGVLADPAFFPGVLAEPYWNSTENPSSKSTAWALNLADGSIVNTDDRGTLHPVMLVRGTKAIGGNENFLISPDGTEATSQMTGALLTWRRCVEGMQWNGSACVGTPQTFTVLQALKHAMDESARTGVAWHVPNVKELNGTVRREHVKPATDPVAFPQAPSGLSCTSSPNVRAASRSWMIDFSVGLVLVEPRSTSCTLRLVRWAGN